MRILLRYLFTGWMLITMISSELLLWKPKEFFRSLLYMPAVFLAMFRVGRDEYINRVSVACLKNFRALELDDAQLVLLRDNPQRFITMSIHYSLLQFWYAPFVRLEVCEEIYTHLSRYWCWKHDIDPALAELPDLRLARPANQTEPDSE